MERVPNVRPNFGRMLYASINVFRWSLVSSVSASTPTSEGEQEKPKDLNRSSEGAETERRRRRVGRKWGGGIPLPIRLVSLGSVVSSINGVRGAPDENDFSAFKASQNASGCTA